MLLVTRHVAEEPFDRCAGDGNAVVKVEPLARAESSAQVRWEISGGGSILELLERRDLVHLLLPCTLFSAPRFTF